VTQRIDWVKMLFLVMTMMETGTVKHDLMVDFLVMTMMETGTVKHDLMVEKPPLVFLSLSS
jgi:hypothetical protein